MSIVTNEIKIYKSAVFNDLSSNGGRMSANLSTPGALDNIFPSIQQAERVAGSEKWRKVFIKVENDDDLTFLSPVVFLVRFTPGDDIITIFEGTHTDIQSDVSSPDPDQYGVGKLNAGVSIGAEAVTVDIEDGTEAPIFRVGDKIAIFDLVTGSAPDLVSGTGNIEYRTIDSIGGTTNQPVLNFTGGLDNAYGNTNTYVASVIEASDVQFFYDSFLVTSVGSGDYDDSTYPIAGDNIGSVYDTWTLTFTSATAFNCVGGSEGSVGSGVVSSNFAPVNANFSKPFFTIDSSGWSGTFQSGDTVQFTTYPASIPIWCRRIVPAGAAALSPNNWYLGGFGASA